MSCCDDCEVCGKQFKERHYTWFVCLDCHKKIDDPPDMPIQEYYDRLANKEELE